MIHNIVPEGTTLPLQPIVLKILQCRDEGAQLQRVYTKGDGSCMLNNGHEQRCTSLNGEVSTSRPSQTDD
jgi:hypothetical protein